MKERYRLEFITPLFCRGMDQGRPEIRPASIRGHLHWWFRALGGRFEDEHAIFGGIKAKRHRFDERASKVVVRVSGVDGETGEWPTLPHKQGNRASPQACFLPGTSCAVEVSTRLGGLSTQNESQFRRALDAWLLLGSLGLRSTRGGGSFARLDRPEPSDVGSLEAEVARLTGGSTVSAAALPETYRDAEAARRDVTNTIEFPRSGYPLGAIKPKRKTSPLKLRVTRFSDGYRIVAIWDSRHNRPEDLKSAADALAQANKPIGRQLKPAVEQLTRA